MSVAPAKLNKGAPPMRAFLLTAAIVLASLALLFGGWGAPAAGPTPDELLLVDLMTEYYGALEPYWDAERSYRRMLWTGLVEEGGGFGEKGVA